jgi:hypothetical protein
MVPDRVPERVEAGPGEAADEGLVDVGEPGVGQVAAQVVQVGPGGPVGGTRANLLLGGGRQVLWLGQWLTLPARPPL